MRAPPELQWGRSLLTAENVKQKATKNVSNYASMGPQSFNCGKGKHIYLNNIKKINMYFREVA
jgi:hypothetical protein